jgi:hypothetical protein
MRSVLVHRRKKQRRLANTVLRIEIGARVEESADHRRSVSSRRVVQSGVAQVIPRIRVSAALKRGAYLRCPSCLRCREQVSVRLVVYCAGVSHRPFLSWAADRWAR